MKLVLPGWKFHPIVDGFARVVNVTTWDATILVIISITFIGGGNLGRYEV